MRNIFVSAVALTAILSSSAFAGNLNDNWVSETQINVNTETSINDVSAFTVTDNTVSSEAVGNTISGTQTNTGGVNNTNTGSVTQLNVGSVGTSVNTVTGTLNVSDNEISGLSVGNDASYTSRNRYGNSNSNTVGSLQVNVAATETSVNDVSSPLIVNDNEISAASIGNNVNTNQENRDSTDTTNTFSGIQANVFSSQTSVNTVDSLAVADNDISAVTLGNSNSVTQRNVSATGGNNTSNNLQVNAFSPNTSANNVSGGGVVSNSISAGSVGNASSFTSTNQ